MTDDIEPCRMCGAKVTVTTREGNRRMSGAVPLVEVRTCTNPQCRSHTGPHRMSDGV